MFREFGRSLTVCILISLTALAGAAASANWIETFDGETLDLTTWEFHPYPDLTKTYTHTVLTDPNGNKYLGLDDTSSAGIGGSQFGAGFGSNEEFADVRVGATVNVTGDASHNHHGLLARGTYFLDDGSVTGAPGLVATQTYVMHVNWEDGPANLRLDIEKVVNLQNIMRNEAALGLDIYVPGLNHARSYYAELDVIGSGPVYVTGRLYEYKDGPLVAKTETMVDTTRNDPWEEEGVEDKPFLSGVSGIFAQNENEAPPGYHCTFDDVFSVSDGPCAVVPSPADGATDVSVDTSLSWIEAAFATGREVWLGKPGAMEKIEPAPAGTTVSVGPLEFNQTYQWRVDQIGPSGAVTGQTWSFTTAGCRTVEDFESYADDAAIQAAWVDNIGEAGVHYVFLATDSLGNNSMRFEFQNQFPPYFTEATRTFETPQDFTAQAVQTLSLFFVGERENVEHPMYVTLEDAAGQSLKVEHPYPWACESELWREWNITLEQFSSAGVDLTNIKKFTIGLGSGLDSGQEAEDRDGIWIDPILLCPAAVL